MEWIWRNPSLYGVDGNGNVLLILCRLGVLRRTRADVLVQSSSRHKKGSIGEVPTTYF